MPWRRGVGIIEAEAAEHRQVAGEQQVTEDSKDLSDGELEDHLSQLAWTHRVEVSG